MAEGPDIAGKLHEDVDAIGQQETGLHGQRVTPRARQRAASFNAAGPRARTSAFTNPTPAAQLLERFGITTGLVLPKNGAVGVPASALPNFSIPVAHGPSQVVSMFEKEAPRAQNGNHTLQPSNLATKGNPLVKQLLCTQPARPSIATSSATNSPVWRPGGGAVTRAKVTHPNSTGASYASQVAAARARATSRQTSALTSAAGHSPFAAHTPPTSTANSSSFSVLRPFHSAPGSRPSQVPSEPSPSPLAASPSITLPAKAPAFRRPSAALPTSSSEPPPQPHAPGSPATARPHGKPQNRTRPMPYAEWAKAHQHQRSPSLTTTQPNHPTQSAVRVTSPSRQPHNSHNSGRPYDSPDIQSKPAETHPSNFLREPQPNTLRLLRNTESGTGRASPSSPRTPMCAAATAAAAAAAAASSQRFRSSTPGVGAAGGGSGLEALHGSGSGSVWTSGGSSDAKLASFPSITTLSTVRLRPGPRSFLSSSSVSHQAVARIGASAGNIGNGTGIFGGQAGVGGGAGGGPGSSSGSSIAGSFRKKTGGGVLTEQDGFGSIRLIPMSPCGEGTTAEDDSSFALPRPLEPHITKAEEDRQNGDVTSGAVRLAAPVRLVQVGAMQHVVSGAPSSPPPPSILTAANPSVGSEQEDGDSSYGRSWPQQPIRPFRSRLTAHAGDPESSSMVRPIFNTLSSELSSEEDRPSDGDEQLFSSPNDDNFDLASIFLDDVVRQASVTGNASQLGMLGFGSMRRNTSFGASAHGTHSSVAASSQPSGPDAPRPRRSTSARSHTAPLPEPLLRQGGDSSRVESSEAGTYDGGRSTHNPRGREFLGSPLLSGEVFSLTPFQPSENLTATLSKAAWASGGNQRLGNRDSRRQVEGEGVRRSKERTDRASLRKARANLEGRIATEAGAAARAEGSHDTGAGALRGQFAARRPVVRSFRLWMSEDWYSEESADGDGKEYGGEGAEGRHDSDPAEKDDYSRQDEDHDDDSDDGGYNDDDDDDDSASVSVALPNPPRDVHLLVAANSPAGRLFAANPGVLGMLSRPAQPPPPPPSPPLQDRVQRPMDATTVRHYESSAQPPLSLSPGRTGSRNKGAARQLPDTPTLPGAKYLPAALGSRHHVNQSQVSISPVRPATHVGFNSAPRQSDRRSSSTVSGPASSTLNGVAAAFGRPNLGSVSSVPDEGRDSSWAQARLLMRGAVARTSQRPRRSHSHGRASLRRAALSGSMVGCLTSSGGNEAVTTTVAAARGSLGGISNFSALSGPQTDGAYNYPSHGYIRRAAEFGLWEAAKLYDLDLYSSLHIQGHPTSEEYDDPSYLTRSVVAALAHKSSPGTTGCGGSAPSSPGRSGLQAPHELLRSPGRNAAASAVMVTGTVAAACSATASGLGPSSAPPRLLAPRRSRSSPLRASTPMEGAAMAASRHTQGKARLDLLDQILQECLTTATIANNSNHKRLQGHKDGTADAGQRKAEDAPGSAVGSGGHPRQLSAAVLGATASLPRHQPRDALPSNSITSARTPTPENEAARSSPLVAPSPTAGPWMGPVLSQTSTGGGNGNRHGDFPSTPAIATRAAFQPPTPSGLHLGNTLPTTWVPRGGVGGPHGAVAYGPVEHLHNHFLPQYGQMYGHMSHLRNPRISAAWPSHMPPTIPEEVLSHPLALLSPASSVAGSIVARTQPTLARQQQPQRPPPTAPPYVASAMVASNQRGAPSQVAAPELPPTAVASDGAGGSSGLRTHGQPASALRSQELASNGGPPTTDTSRPLLVHACGSMTASSRASSQVPVRALAGTTSHPGPHDGSAMPTSMTHTGGVMAPPATLGMALSLPWPQDTLGQQLARQPATVAHRPPSLEAIQRLLETDLPTPAVAAAVAVLAGCLPHSSWRQRQLVPEAGVNDNTRLAHGAAIAVRGRPHGLPRLQGSRTDPGMSVGETVVAMCGASAQGAVRPAHKFVNVAGTEVGANSAAAAAYGSRTVEIKQTVGRLAPVARSVAALMTLAVKEGMPPKPLLEDCRQAVRGQAGDGMQLPTSYAAGLDFDQKPGPSRVESPLLRAVRLVAQSMLTVLAGAAGATAAASSVNAILVRPHDLPYDNGTSIYHYKNRRNKRSNYR